MKISLAALGIDGHGLDQQFLHTLQRRLINRLSLLLPNGHGVVVVGQRVFRTQLDKARQFQVHAGQRIGRRDLDLAHEKVWFRIGRIQIRCLTKPLGGLIVEGARKERRAQRGQHPRRFWISLDSGGENVFRLPHGAVQQEFRAPFKVILLAGVFAHGALELVHGGEWIAQFLVEFPGKPTRIGVVVVRQQLLDLLAGSDKVTASFESEYKIVLSLGVARIECTRGPQRRNRVLKPLGAEIKLAELTIGFGVAGVAHNGRFQGTFRFRGFAGIARGFTSRRLESERLAIESLAGAENGVRSMAAGCSPVRHGSDGEIRSVGKLHGRGLFC